MSLANANTGPWTLSISSDVKYPRFVADHYKRFSGVLVLKIDMSPHHAAWRYSWLNGDAEAVLSSPGYLAEMVNEDQGQSQTSVLIMCMRNSPKTSKESSRGYSNTLG
jgi:hypothetical protein